MRAAKTGISSLINWAEGVLFVEVAALANDGTSRQLSLQALLFKTRLTNEQLQTLTSL
jgi:hypothetical protein